MTREATTIFSEEVYAEVLSDFARPFASAEAVGAAMRELLVVGLAELPLPASGKTLDRWRALSSVAALDLSLAKIFEGHTDATAIIAELGAAPAEGLCAVWAAEPPASRVIFRPSEKGGTLSGRKSWCSGAAIVDSALTSAWTENGEPCLVLAKLKQSGVSVETADWKAVGMSASESGSVVFENAQARPIGGVGDYVGRAGFWHGGAGIAAVWYGAAVAIAEALARSAKVASDAHAAAHLGALDTSLRAARALLIETAAWIDTHPTADAASAALRLRSCVEATANEVLLRTGRALGAGPLCCDAIHARLCADLPVFLRQSHAEHDLAALGQSVAKEGSPWKF